MTRYSLSLLCATGMLLLAAHADAQSILHVLNADSLVARSINGIDYRELIGRVRMRQDNVSITCDRALQNINANEAELNGNVVITQDTLVLKTQNGRYNADRKIASSSTSLYMTDGQTTLVADNGSYETGSKVAHFFSRVTIEDRDVRISSRALRFERDSSKAIATGDVLLTFKSENAMASGDTVIHYNTSRISILPAMPRLWQIDSVVEQRDSVTREIIAVRLDTLSIVARHMEAHRDSTNVFLAEGRVEIVRGGLFAKCDRALFLRSDSLVVLQTSPILWHDSTQVTGDSISVFLSDNRLRQLSVIGNAFSLARSRPSEKDTLYPTDRYDQISGRSMHLWFSNDDPDSIRVETSATSLYYLYDDRKLNGVRKESGDRIIIRFSEGDVDTILSIGGVEGAYYPEKMVTGIESTYNLDGFTVRTDKPVQPLAPPGILSVPPLRGK